MGNALISHAGCFIIPSSSSSVKIIVYDGTTRILHGRRLAAELMFEFPDCIVCHADSFFLGQPIPALPYDSHLINGEIYFVLPLDCFPNTMLSASCLATIGSILKRGPPVNFKESPFEYVKGSDGRVSIKVTPEFIIKLITRGQETEKTGESSSSSVGDHGHVLCSTPELKKDYDHLVGTKDHIWSPKLETISECKARMRYSPLRCIGLERVHYKEEDDF